MNGLIQGIVRELERSPMNTDAAFRAEIQVDLHRLVQIHVLVLHEPARQAGTDSDECNVESAALRGTLARFEMFAHILEVLAVTRVAGEKPLKISTQNCPSAPQGLVAIAQTAGRPMLRRNQMKFDRAAIRGAATRRAALRPAMSVFIPPIKLHSTGNSNPLQPPLQSQRHQE